MKDADIAVSNAHPETDSAHIVRGIVRKGLKPLPIKQSISLRVDQDVLEWFRAQGTGWQTRMNAVLKAFKDVSAETQGLPPRSTRMRARSTRAG